MENVAIYLALTLTGLCFGSFAGASVWRLRARQLVQDKTDSERVDADEFKHLNKLAKTTFTSDRSRCLHCSYVLRWYDLIPVASWLCLGGRCRKCRQRIGIMEPLIEIGMAAFFLLSYTYWPYPLESNLEIARFVLWLIAGIGLGILFVYDAKWFLLPDQVNYAVIGVGLVSAILALIGSNDKLATFISIVISVLILSGMYLVLYIISKGRWIGFGDIKLGFGLALILVNWELAFITLFSANMIGCFIVIPAMISGKLKRNSQVPFGPLLIIGFVIAGLAGEYLLSSYLNLVGL